MTKNKLLNGLIIGTLVILFAGVALSIFFLIYNNADILGIRTLGMRTETPANPAAVITSAPTPTPPYYSFISQVPDYVGSIEEINSPNQIVVKRENQSKIILNLQPEIPIYFPVTKGNNQLEVETRSLDHVKVGNTISIYTDDKNILAIFVNEE